MFQEMGPPSTRPLERGVRGAASWRRSGWDSIGIYIFYSAVLAQVYWLSQEANKTSHTVRDKKSFTFENSITVLIFVLCFLTDALSKSLILLKNEGFAKDIC